MKQRIIIRNLLNGLGILGIILFLIGSPGRYYLLIGSAIAFFLGVTDFGRQCPLFLSVKHLLFRLRQKNTSKSL